MTRCHIALCPACASITGLEALEALAIAGANKGNAMADKRLFGGTIRTALVHAATRYDVRQSKGKRYNVYALAQYLTRIDDVCADIANGAAPRDAIVAGFSGPLLNAMLKAVFSDKATHNEIIGYGKGWTYQPAARNAQ
jgi:hypothetical protein